jgi:hypothetical protein
MVTNFNLGAKRKLIETLAWGMNIDGLFLLVPAGPEALVPIFLSWRFPVGFTTNSIVIFPHNLSQSKLNNL